MTESEYWEFTEIKNTGFTKGNQERVTRFLAQLHSKYFNHQYYIPCTCSSKTWQEWIDQLNVIHKNGFEQSS
tara:strand:+ start:24077 stop:24292 length:216 start_codon:yes stop_codon:yes gene_type:complete